jgi:MSHA biogenesis protein MshK
MHTIPSVVLGLALLLPGAGPALAQVLADPTRPPAALLSGAFVPGAAPANALQSIILSGGRKIAVINGQSVPLGGKYGDARLIGIAAAEVRLQSDKGIEVMKLYPGLEKRSTSVWPVQPKKGAGS